MQVCTCMYACECLFRRIAKTPGQRTEEPQHAPTQSQNLKNLPRGSWDLPGKKEDDSCPVWACNGELDFR